MKYTPGPWFVRKMPKDDGLAVIERGTDEDNYIAECEWHNADLISAAPYLYEALKDVFENVRNDSAEMWARVEKALLKAEGRQS